jgi:hypothetical protein
VGIQDALEGAIPADLVTPAERGTAYGAMGAVNGFGDLFASALTGTLRTMVSPVAAFACAAGLMLAGAAAVYLRPRPRRIFAGHDRGGYLRAMTAPSQTAA